MSDDKSDFEAQAAGERTGIVREFVDFLGENKKWWLAPIIISILLLGYLGWFMIALVLVHIVLVVHLLHLK